MVDFAALPDAYKVPNEAAINKVAGALKENCQIPGVEVTSEWV